MLVGTPMTSSLRRLHLDGTEITAVPDCIRPLALTYLGLQRNGGLRELPEWLGELPLVTLELGNTEVRSLPQSFHASTTLRSVVLTYTPLGLDSLDDMGFWQSGKVDLVEEELKPLSLAQPQIRFQLLTEEAQCDDDTQIPGWNGWWHAKAEAEGIDLRQGIRQPPEHSSDEADAGMFPFNFDQHMNEFPSEDSESDDDDGIFFP